MAVVALHTSKKTSTILRQLAGASVNVAFVSIWLGSIFSPMLLIGSFAYGYNMLGAASWAITICSYLPWKPGFLSKALRSYCQDYNPYHYKETIVKYEGDKLPSADPNVEPQTFYAVHPHGAFSMGWANLYVDKCLANVRFCFSPVLLMSPFFRMWSRMVGHPGSASKAAMISYLDKGESLALPPGGFEEATLTYSKKDRAYIKKRTGFVKLCLQRGVQIRPAYTFGENSLFWNLQGFWDLRLALNRMGLPAIVIWGMPLFPLLPRKDVKLLVVVGKPLVLPKIPNPTKEEVKIWHDKYMVALQTLYDNHKEEAYGPEQAKTRKLELW